MNRNVTQRAGLILLGLVVESWRCRGTGINGQGVALQTEEIHLAALQKARVGGAVRGMAGYATFGLNHRMLIYKRSGFVRMTLEADGVLRGSGAQLARQESTVRIMAIAALHEPFVNTMMKGARELLLCFEMAAVAKLWLLLFHQELAFLRIMRRVAFRTTDVVLEMGGACKVAVLLTVGVTPKTTLADFLCGGILEGEDFRFVAAPVDVLLSRSVAGFASMPLRSFLRIERGYIMR